MWCLFVEGCAGAAPSETCKGSGQDPTLSFTSTQLWASASRFEVKALGG